MNHLVSKKAFLILGAFGVLLLALALDNAWSTAAYVVAASALAALLFAMSMKMSELYSSLRRLSRDLESFEHQEGDKPPIEETWWRAQRASRLGTAISAIQASANEAPQTSKTASASSSPLITVVIPCYNEERFVAETIRSVAQQSFSDWECVIVDDASTDDSLSAIWNAVAGDSRFRVLRHKVNSGLGASRNTGLRTARGEFITFLDSDDLLMSDSLIDRATALADALGDPHVIGSYCGVRVDLEDVSLDDLPTHVTWKSRDVVDFLTSDGECPFNSHAPLLITEKARSLGGFNEAMRHGAEDWDLWYRAMRNGYIFVPSRSKTAIYRQKARSMVRVMAEGHTAEADRLIDACYEKVDPEILRSPTPTPYTEPIGHYRARVQKARRAIRFATMALLANDQDGARRTLEHIRDLPLEILNRHVDVADLVRRGMQRALAIKSEELDQLHKQVLKTTDRVQSIIDQISPQAERPPQTRKTLRAGALLVPQHAGQVEAMLHVARDRGFGQDSIAFLSIEREAGNQGASEEIPEGYENWSLNEWVLGDIDAEVMVVGSVRVDVVDRLAQTISATGGEVIEVPQGYAKTMRIQEAHREPLGSYAGTGSAGVTGQFLGASNSDATVLSEDPAATWSIEEYPETTSDSLALAELKDQHRGDRVVIIGNGPSLNECDLKLLKNEYTIAVNGIFYAADRMGFDPTYYVVEDTAVMRDNLEAIREYAAGHKFFPSIYRHLVGEQANVSYFMMNRGFYEPRSPDYCIPRFSLDPAQRIYSGQSVTIINLQLAYHLGFEEVVLIGMDFSYDIPKDATVEGDLIISAGADPNHFHPDYFGKGKVWKDPKLDRVLANYALAKEVYEANGRRIVNATVGGRLELFDRVSYDEYFGS